MRWFSKAIAFKILSSIPYGEDLYGLLQKKITKSVVPTNENLLQKMQVGKDYLEFLREKYGDAYLDSLTHIDIGAGWMPTIPLLFYGFGIDNQVLCDVRPNMSIKSVSNTVYIFRQILQKSEIKKRIFLKRLPPYVEKGEDLTHYFSRIGVRYFAPYDYNDLQLKDNMVKLITCTQVLPYLNRSELKRFFRRIVSILDGGTFIATVHLYDLYSDFDHKISRFNKYRYSELFWERVVNSRLMTFNRLTASDYQRLLKDTGFEIVKFNFKKPTISDLEQLRRIRVHRKFRTVPETELGSSYLFMVARKR